MLRTLITCCLLLFAIEHFGQSIIIEAPLCAGSPATLRINNPPAGVGFQWLRNNVVIIGATDLVYNPTQADTYSVVLIGAGRRDTLATVTLIEQAIPQPSFTFTDNLCASTAVAFSNTTPGTGNTYTWIFGDPNAGRADTSRLVNPSHRFRTSVTGNSTQTFTVRLIATNATGCSAQSTQQLTVKEIPDASLGTDEFPVILDGKTYFTKCTGLGPAVFPLANASTTKATNTGYAVVWGNGAPNFTGTTFTDTIRQTYQEGPSTIQFTVDGNNGCSVTEDIFIFVGSNPAVGLGNPGNTNICTGSSLTFPISNTGSNSAGTIYTVSFNDGSAPESFPHPAPSSITHLFEKNSCGITSFSSGAIYANSFAATIIASNPCQTSSASVVPIYVSQSPTPVINAVGDSVCTNRDVTFTNATSVKDFINGGQCIPSAAVWSISPATGWTVKSGALGSENGSVNPAQWTLGTADIVLNFSAAGTYTIKLKMGNTRCGATEITRTVCVNAPPVASFSVDKTTGCSPVDVAVTNNSGAPTCGNYRYRWTVSYSNPSGCTPGTSDFSFTNGTSNGSENPAFRFVNPGTYTISLVVIAPGGQCSSVPFSQEIVVKDKPGVSLPTPPDFCQGGTLSPVATVNNCYSSTAPTYSWTFSGGSPATSTLPTPGPISYAGAGAQTIDLTVSNECGATVVPTVGFNVTPAPAMTNPGNTVVCAGADVPATAFSSGGSGVSYSWTNSNPAIGLAASGNGNLPAFRAANTGATPQVATITVTPAAGCSGAPISFTITVNPRPAAPAAATPLVYCQNTAAPALTATPTGSNTLLWYDNSALTNGSPTAPVPPTTTAGQATFYVTQSDGTCVSPPAAIVVNTAEAIGRNTIGGSQTICAGTPAAPLSPTQALTGGTGSYTYQWQQSTDGGTTWTDIAGAIAATYDPGALTQTTRYRRVVGSGVCSGSISNEVTITVDAAISGSQLAGGNQVICAGSIPAALNGQTASGSPTYQWQQSANGSSWSDINGATNEDYQPATLSVSTYFRRLTTSGSCSAASNALLVTVNPLPVMNPVTDILLCNRAAFAGQAFSAQPVGSMGFAWTANNTAIGLAASGTGNLPAFTAQNNSNIPVTAAVSVIPTLTADGQGCAGSPLNFNITVLPTISVQAIPNQEVCSGETVAQLQPVHNAGNTAGSAISYRWTVSGSGISLRDGSGSAIPAFNVTNGGSANLQATITVVPVYLYGGTNCDGTATSYTVTVKPAAPPASAGADATLCAATSYTMQATPALFGGGRWTQTSGISANIVNPISPTTTMNGLQPGTYVFEWRVTGAAGCPTTSDEVTVVVLPPVVNTVATAAQTVCSGQTVLVTGQPASGGNGSYRYQWQISTDGGASWSDIGGQNGASLLFQPQQNSRVRRNLFSGVCTDPGQAIEIRVQPALAGNTITASQTICIGNTAAQLQGAQPIGGDGNYRYQWQQSTDGGATWTDIALAAGANYQPVGPSATTQYRRIVNTALCTGPQALASNVVTITVNPDALAALRTGADTACAPYILGAAAITLLPDAARNSGYEWYINGRLAGTGLLFPGYTIANPNDSVIIRLKALSLYGCKPDSLERRFYSFKRPEPAFTISTTGGCGPLDVQVSNTTPERDRYRYYWTFGNGASSVQAQPGVVRFAPNPSFGDTTYTITLHAISACDTFRVTRKVAVNSKPRALFLPSRSTGCSPMRVTFNNSSLGLGNTYSWRFDDGTVVNTATADSVVHTFITGVTDTFNVRLIANNACGSDTSVFAIVAAPNNIRLDFAVNGTEQSGCAPHTVRFINNTRGATSFRYDFGDGNIFSSTRGIDTITHQYARPGRYTVRLFAANSCTDTSATEVVQVFAQPRAAFTASRFQVCVGDTVRFTNLSDSANAYFWQFGDTATSTLVAPEHRYRTPGLYTVRLTALRVNAQGSFCPDTTSLQVSVAGSLPGAFDASDTVGICAPFTVTYTNRNLPAAIAAWDFGDGNTGSGNVVAHTFTAPGDYRVQLTAQSPGGCVYQSERTISIQGPSGSFSYSGGFVCNDNAVRFQVQASNTDTIEWHFGDGTRLKTTTNVVYHAYANGGAYLPSAMLITRAGCQLLLPGTDSIRVDKVEARFTSTRQPFCGYTTLGFRDEGRAYYGQAAATWNFGDGSTGAGLQPSHTYDATGTYPIQLIVTSLSGCQDTLTLPTFIKVNDLPSAAISALDSACTDLNTRFRATVQAVDSIGAINWRLSNGAQATGNLFQYNFAEGGTYTLRLVAGTVNGCYDTAFRTIEVGTTPHVLVSASQQICAGTNARLRATGAGRFEWSPVEGLSCTTCPDPLATPAGTTTYLVTGITDHGCTDTASVMVTVIPRFRLTVSPNDSICIGQSSLLQASGALNYRWSPAATLSSATIANPVATPTVTTTYRVIGDDGQNCFSDTAFVTVAVGQYPLINLGPDLTLSTGTLHPLASVVQNGPIRTYEWRPATDLSCADCPQPNAFIRKDITYTVKGTTAYGCSDTDTISIKVFCESSQVFIPNAFTPDGDGVNDVLMVRAKGIAMVKTFRVFNRWGQVVFEKSSFRPNDAASGWNGRVQGVVGAPEVYMYTAEVICENGSTYTYKGNVSILK